MANRSLAAAQTAPARGDVDANLDVHVRVARVVAGHADVVVFPELSLTGYELDLADELAFREDDARLRPLQSAATACSVTMVVGAPVRIDEGLCIGAFVIDPGGATGLYTKHHLGGEERATFVPGDRKPQVRLGTHAAAVAICADIGHASHAARAASEGATCYLASTFLTPDDLPGKHERLRGYAARHAMAVVLSNYGAASGGLPAAGASAIWAPGGERLVQLDAEGSAIALATEGGSGWRTRVISLPG